jgi:hypothetical protein
MKIFVLAVILTVGFSQFLPLEGIRNLRGPNQDIIQQFLNGLFEANGLADPTTITPCIDDDSAA